MKFEMWLEDLKRYWLKKDIKSIVGLFDEKVKYYETPFEKVENIELVWKDIEGQELINLEYKIMGMKKNTVTANFIMELPNRRVDMVYEVELNENNICTYFKQWFMSNNP